MDLREKLSRTASLRVATWNVLFMNREGSAELVANELSRLSVTVAGLTEVRWPGSGTHVSNDYSYHWSGRDEKKSAVKMSAEKSPEKMGADKSAVKKGAEKSPDNIGTEKSPDCPPGIEVII